MIVKCWAVSMLHDLDWLVIKKSPPKKKHKQRKSLIVNKQKGLWDTRNIFCFRAAATVCDMCNILRLVSHYTFLWNICLWNIADLQFSSFNCLLWMWIETICIFRKTLGSFYMFSKVHELNVTRWKSLDLANEWMDTNSEWISILEPWALQTFIQYISMMNTSFACWNVSFHSGDKISHRHWGHSSNCLAGD